ncbi:MAG: hypothetical protein KTR31_38790 [Myxococcales bacterium]|nr:hypothetical protein [Myxococcales bacterium]
MSMLVAMSALSTSALAQAPAQVRVRQVAQAQERHCRLREADYVEIRQNLRSLRRSKGGGTLVVAGDGPSCEAALQAIIENDPLLNVRMVDAPRGEAVGYMAGIADGSGECAAVLRPNDDGWALVSVGDCEAPRVNQPRAFTLSYWEPTGVSLRWNERLFDGFFMLMDGAYQIDESAVGQLGPSWRVLGGVDMTRGPLSGAYVGTRLGVRHVTTREGEDTDAVLQMAVGHRWIAGTTTLQIGGGVLARVPMFEGLQRETLHPLLEIRLGVAPRQ